MGVEVGMIFVWLEKSKKFSVSIRGQWNFCFVIEGVVEGVGWLGSSAASEWYHSYQRLIGRRDIVIGIHMIMHDEWWAYKAVRDIHMIIHDEWWTVINMRDNPHIFFF